MILDMKNSQKGFIPLIFILIVIILIAIAWYFIPKKNNVENNIQSAATSSPRILMTTETMVGSWQSGDSDAGSVKMELSASGKFTVVDIYSYIEPGEYPEGYDFPEPTKTEGSGTWSVGTNNGQPYLSLKFDRDFKGFPKTEEEIQWLQKHGQEFVGGNEFRLAPEYYKEDTTLTFRYSGFLMNKVEEKSTTSSSASSFYFAEPTCANRVYLKNKNGDDIQFQTSAPRGASSQNDGSIDGGAELGLRNKFGEAPDRFDFTVKVIFQFKTQVFETKKELVSHEWTFVNYPKDAPGNIALEKGIYYVEYYIDNKKVACDAFEVR